MSIRPPDESIYTTRAKPIVVDSQRQLFLDDYIIEAASGLERRINKPVKHGPVLRPQTDMGQVSLQSRSVPQWNPEQKLWEWWYWGNWECPPYGPYQSTSVALTHYAVSSDGLNWERPELGLFEWKSCRRNNIAIEPSWGHRSLYHIIRDQNEPDASRRYKGLFGSRNRKPMVSADDFNWQPLGESDIPCSDESHFLQG